jgi:hypothetical protein
VELAFDADSVRGVSTCAAVLSGSIIDCNEGNLGRGSLNPSFLAAPITNAAAQNKASAQPTSDRNIDVVDRLQTCDLLAGLVSLLSVEEGLFCKAYGFRRYVNVKFDIVCSLIS